MTNIVVSNKHTGEVLGVIDIDRKTRNLVSDRLVRMIEHYHSKPIRTMPKNLVGLNQPDQPFTQDITFFFEDGKEVTVVLTIAKTW